jgi:hypothetical protein
MKNTLLLSALGLSAIVGPLQAEILEFDLSPVGTSPGTGLSQANEVPPATGTGSGNEVFTGISYNTDTNVLSVALGYGSFAGFTDLTGVATAAHIHGPAPVTGTAPPVHDFFTAAQHIPAPVPTAGGLIIGNATLSDVNETNLLAGQLYINIHTAANVNGEIRAQLVEATNAAPTVICPEPSEVECTSHDDTEVELFATVGDVDGDELTVVWTIDGEAQPEVVVPAGDGPSSEELSITTTLALGEHTVSVAVSDGTSVTASCETTVTVEDTTDPVITSVTTNPKSLWPPNHKLREVTVNVEAEDACGEVTTKILSVSSNEEGGDDDWVIVDDDTVKLRSERLGKGSGRVYTITVEATDESGNTATETTEVTVAKSQGRGHGAR